MKTVRPAALSLALISVFWILPLQAQNTGAVRFFGSGSDTSPNRDRVNIPIDDNINGAQASTVADVGSGNFTVEFWLRGILAANTSNTGLSAGSHAGIAWTTGNVIVDRDIYTTSSQPGDSRDWGISILGGRVAFGTGFDSTASQPDSESTLLGAINVLNGQWNHVAVVREASSGRKSIYVNGQLDVSSVAHPSNDDLSFPDTGLTNNYSAFNNFLVLGAEKHDYPGSFYFAGDFDELRVWNSARTAAQIHSARNTVLPPATVGLAGYWRFEEVGGTTIQNLVAGNLAGILINNSAGNGLRITSSQGPNTVPNLNGPDTYEDWALLFIPVVADRGKLIDADSDGSNNFSEFALGTLPSDPTSLPAVDAAIVDNQLAIRFLRARGDVNYGIWGSSNLSSWELVVTNPGTVGSVVTAKDAPAFAGEPKRFLRLRISE